MHATDGISAGLCVSLKGTTLRHLHVVDPVSCADVQLGTALFRNCMDVVPAVVTSSTDRTVAVCNFVKFVTVPVPVLW